MCMPARRPVSRRNVLTGLGGLGLVAGASACGVQSEQPNPADSPAPSTGGGSSTTNPTGGATSSATAGTASAAQIAPRATVPVLCYHQVRPHTSDDSGYTRENLVIEPGQLAAHLDAIAQAGFTTITPDQYYTHLETGQGLPSKPVLLSFDDGKDNQATAALSAVQERKMTATFFVMTVILGNKGWLSKDDVKKFADAGMTVGSHTWDHHMVTKYTEQDWKKQFEEPRETLRKLSGQEVADFAYPYGAWNEAALPHLRSAGYRAAYQLSDKPLLTADPLYTLRRLLAGSSWTGQQVVEKLTNFAA